MPFIQPSTFSIFSPLSALVFITTMVSLFSSLRLSISKVASRSSIDTKQGASDLFSTSSTGLPLIAGRESMWRRAAAEAPSWKESDTSTTYTIPAQSFRYIGHSGIIAPPTSLHTMLRFLSIGKVLMSTPTDGTTSASTCGSRFAVLCRANILRSMSDLPEPPIPSTTIGEVSSGTVMSTRSSRGGKREKLYYTDSCTAAARFPME
mmetsp:Transcript_12864/g.55216  ORF Transcript_12864/g.55216 Transcript_12864/m.55216 type:complete len:206 (+) Transcript_12864:1013-1630(+)